MSSSLSGTETSLDGYGYGEDCAQRAARTLMVLLGMIDPGQKLHREVDSHRPSGRQLAASTTQACHGPISSSLLGEPIKVTALATSQPAQPHAVTNFLQFGHRMVGCLMQQPERCLGEGACSSS